MVPRMGSLARFPSSMEPKLPFFFVVARFAENKGTTLSNFPTLKFITVFRPNKRRKINPPNSARKSNSESINKSILHKTLCNTSSYPGGHNCLAVWYSNSSFRFSLCVACVVVFFFCPFLPSDPKPFRTRLLINKALQRQHHMLEYGRGNWNEFRKGEAQQQKKQQTLYLLTLPEHRRELPFLLKASRSA